MVRRTLRHGFDRDVYQIIKKLEEEGKPFKTVTAAYDAIKRSNSSLSRQKKRPLEDAIDRVLQFRKEERDDSSEDSEAALDAHESRIVEDDRFLLNKQMTKLWRDPPTAQASSDDPPAAKKRRIQDDGEATTTTAAPSPRMNGTGATTEKGEKASLQKKPQKQSRFRVEQLANAPVMGGVAELEADLCREAHRALRWPSLFTQHRWDRDSGVLISGPPGIGKKSLVRRLAWRLGVPLISLEGCLEDPERMEKSLGDAIDEALRIAPSIVLIEHLDWYISKPGSTGHTEHHRRAMTQLLRHFKRISQDAEGRCVLAMATTSMEADVDPAILTFGAFDTTIQMRIPDGDARRDIWEVVIGDKDKEADVDFHALAKLSHGFVGVDVAKVVKQAERAAVRRSMDATTEHELSKNLDAQDITEGGDDQNVSTQESPRISLSMDDFKHILKDFTPSLRKEGFTVIPNVTWDQVGALDKVREQLETSITGPIKDPELFQSFGLDRPAGVLLWGPPGCGKTLVAQAVANEAQASFILINGPELLNKYVGESERAVRELFQRARSSTPCILFFDEMDSLVPHRDGASTDSGARVVNALLTELDGAQDRSGIYVIGTTNRPDMIDAAMLRPGRLSVRLFVDLPTPAERVDILRAIYRTKHATPAAVDLEAIARDSRCDNFSGADLGALHDKAAEHALRRFVKQRGRAAKTEALRPEIVEADWAHALANTKPSVTNPETYWELEAKLERTAAG